MEPALGGAAEVRVRQAATGVKVVAIYSAPA